MKACFADFAEVPMKCNHDLGEPWNCVPGVQGIEKVECEHWQPARAIKLALDILGVGQ